MEMVVECDRGWRFQGSEEDLVVAVQRHGREVHNLEVTREQALALAKPVPQSGK